MDYFHARVSHRPLATGTSVQMRKLLFVLTITATIHCATGGEPEAPAGQDTLTGTWGGLRERFAKRGITFSGEYTGEVLGNTTGGLRRGAEYTGFFEFAVELDTKELINWPGAKLHIGAIYPHGGNVAEKYTGDLAGLSNIESYDSLRLFEAWLEQKFLDDRVAIRIGFMAVDSDFALNDTAELFINSNFGSLPATGLNLPMPAWPFSAPGVLLRIEPTAQTHIQFAAYDGNPATGVLTDPTPGAASSNDFNKHNTRVALRGDEGAMLCAEIGWRTPEPAGGEKNAPLATSIKLGGTYHTDRFADTRDATLELASPRSHRGNSAIYFVAEQEIWREHDTEADGLTAFLRVAYAPPDRNYFRMTAETGLVYRGIFQSDARDALALGFAWLDISPRVAAAQRSIGAHPDDYEAVIELTYQHALTPWCSIQPDLQYIIHPGGSSAHDNALVVGLRTTITF